MYSVGVIQEDVVVGDEPMENESAAITLAYNRSISDDKCHCVLSGTGDDQKVLYILWGGEVFKRHDL